MSKIEHPYSEINVNKDPQTYLYDQAEVHWGYHFILFRHIENYTITQKLGRGKYSHVFEGNDKKNRRKIAIKVLLPIKPEKIKREYIIHRMLNHPNIIKLHDIVRCPK